MIPSAFDYARPKSLDEAFTLLAEYGDGAKLLAGGHSLVPMMKLRLAEPAVLIDLQSVPDLSGMSFSGGKVTIGAMTTHAALAASADLEKHAPVLSDAARQLGDSQVRNRGTIGGASAHGDPSADYPAVLHALGAQLTLVSRGGTRTVSVDDFFQGMFATELRPGEILTSISFDAAPASSYAKYHHPASGYAIVGAAVVLQISGGKIGSARVAVTGVGDAAFRAGAVERALAGQSASDADAIRAASAGAAAGVDGRSDSQASASYRIAMADVYVERAILQAAGRV